MIARWPRTAPLQIAYNRDMYDDAGQAMDHWVQLALWGFAVNEPRDPWKVTGAL